MPEGAVEGVAVLDVAFDAGAPEAGALGGFVPDDFALEDDDSPSEDAGPALPDSKPYASAYQPPPFRMKLPPEIMRRALSLPHTAHFLMGASVMRCSRSKSPPHASQW